MKKGILTTLILLATALNGWTDFPDAKEFYQEGLDHMQQKDYITAIGDFTNAISMNPNYGDAYYLRAKAKDMLAKQYGFSNSAELCFDLTTALNLGKANAIAMLEENCMNECYDNKTAFDEPAVVFCADFSSKALGGLPSRTGELINVVNFNFFDNNATSLSTDIAKMHGLLNLNLASNKLTSLTASIGQLRYLQELNLNRNQLTTLPYEFGNLGQLERLYIRQNQLKELPKSIARVKSLRELDLSMNQLKSLPFEVAGLKNLKTLILVGNDINSTERKKIQALLPHTKIIFE